MIQQQYNVNHHKLRGQHTTEYADLLTKCRSDASGDVVFFRYKFDYTQLLIKCGYLLVIELSPNSFDENFSLVSVGTTTLHGDQEVKKEFGPCSVICNCLLLKSQKLHASKLKQWTRTLFLAFHAVLQHSLHPQSYAIFSL